MMCVFGFLLTVAARHRLELLQWVKTKQSDLEMTAFQLLYYQVSSHIPPPFSSDSTLRLACPQTDG